jgi:hypothetical protein
LSAIANLLLKSQFLSIAGEGSGNGFQELDYIAGQAAKYREFQKTIRRFKHAVDWAGTRLPAFDSCNSGAIKGR